MTEIFQALKTLEGHRLLIGVGAGAYLLTAMGQGLVEKARKNPENEAQFQAMLEAGMSESMAQLTLLLGLTEQSISEWNALAGMAGEGR